jgi:hypothetical protein
MRAGLLVVPLLVVSALPVAGQHVPQPRRPSLLRVAAHAAGGALVGGWGGYMAAQVAWSDWADREGRGAQRIRFSVTGAALGLIGGVMIGRSSPGAAPVPGLPPHIAPPGHARPITEAEIDASSARTVTELVRQLRPGWLRDRGTDILPASPDSQVVRIDDPHAAHGVRVYLNGGLLGGLETLDQVSVHAVTGVQFLEAPAAILRWGAGHDDGAILLTTTAAP